MRGLLVKLCLMYDKMTSLEMMKAQSVPNESVLSYVSLPRTLPFPSPPPTHAIVTEPPGFDPHDDSDFLTSEWSCGGGSDKLNACGADGPLLMNKDVRLFCQPR